MRIMSFSQEKETGASFRGRLLGIGLIMAVILILLVALFYWQENVTGRRHLEEATAKVRNAGVELEFEPVLDDPPLSDRNFYTAPLVRGLADIEFPTLPDGNVDFGNPQFSDPASIARLRKMQLPSVLNRYGDYIPGRGFTSPLRPAKGPELEVWAAWFRSRPGISVEETDSSWALQVLQAIETLYREEWKDLETAAARPESHLPAHWIELPFLENGYRFPGAALQAYRIVPWHVLKLRILCAARTGDSETFRSSLDVQLKFLEGMAASGDGSQGLLLASLVEAVIGVIWNVLDDSSLESADLLWAADRLGKLDMPSAVARTAENSAARALLTMEALKRQRRAAARQFAGFGTAPTTWEVLGMYLVPDGWFDRNAASILIYQERAIIQPIRGGDFRSLAGIDSRLPEKWSREGFLARGHLVDSAFVISRLAQPCVFLKMAEMACRLEAFALDHGSYPDEESELVPEIVPNLPDDPFSDGPIRYQRTGGRYFLYSVGPNLTDDLGRTERDRQGRLHPLQGDWVWTFELPPEERRSQSREEVRSFLEVEYETDFQLSDRELKEAAAKHLRKLREQRQTREEREKAEKIRRIKEQMRRER